MIQYTSIMYICVVNVGFEKSSRNIVETHTQRHERSEPESEQSQSREHTEFAQRRTCYGSILCPTEMHMLCVPFGVSVFMCDWGENDGFHHSFVLLYSYTHHARTVSCHSQVWGRNCNRIFYYKWISAWVEWRLRGSFSPEQRMMVNVGREGIVGNGKGHVHQPANGPINRVRRRIHTWWIRFKYARAISLNVGIQLIILCVLYAWWASI